MPPIIQDSKTVYLMCINVSLGSIYFGYLLGVFNTCSDVISYFNNWNEDERSSYIGPISAIILIGALIGSFTTEFFVKLCKGYRNVLVYTDLIGIINLLIMIRNTEFLNLFITRLVAGLILGFNIAIIPVYIREFSPIEISGRTGSIHSLLIVIGLLISYLIGMLLPNSKQIAHMSP